MNEPIFFAIGMIVVVLAVCCIIIELVKLAGGEIH
jgi:hypothetical protein